jgi:predicted DNA-binding protein
MSMSLRSVMIQFSELQIEQLDAEARRTGRSRAQVVRDAIDQTLPVRFDQSLANQYSAAYPTPEHGDDEWGSLDTWHEAARVSRLQK